jgi:hypothetical protein
MSLGSAKQSIDSGLLVGSLFREFFFELLFFVLHIFLVAASERNLVGVMVYLTLYPKVKSIFSA